MPSTLTEAEVREALDAVRDPELDEPVTDLGFVRSVAVRPGREGSDATAGTQPEVEVHLRLPTSFCSPSFAYLMASDAKDVVSALPGAGAVVVALDDHHDSEIINAGLAADAGWLGTFPGEAQESLDELRWTFRRKAHTAAMERCLTALLRAEPDRPVSDLGSVRLADLPDDDLTAALLRRRAELGLPGAAEAFVLVDEAGETYAPDDVPLALRRARSTRISIDGNAHFCRGLLRTRYPGSEADQTERAEGAEGAEGSEGSGWSEEAFVPLATLTVRTREPQPTHDTRKSPHPEEQHA